VQKLKIRFVSNYQARLASQGPAAQSVGTQVRLRFNVFSFPEEGILLDFLSLPP